MEKLNKLSLPAVIIIASLILGGFYYASQVNKQRSIERQQQIKIQDDKQQQEIKIEQEKQAQLDKELKEQQAKEEAEQALDTCLKTAYLSYSANFKSECKTRSLKEDCSLSSELAESLDNAYKDDKADCFKRYPQK